MTGAEFMEAMRRFGAAAKRAGFSIAQLEERRRLEEPMSAQQELEVIRSERPTVAPWEAHLSAFWSQDEQRDH